MFEADLLKNTDQIIKGELAKIYLRWPNLFKMTPFLHSLHYDLIKELKFTKVINA